VGLAPGMNDVPCLYLGQQHVVVEHMSRRRRRADLVFEFITKRVWEKFCVKEQAAGFDLANRSEATLVVSAVTSTFFGEHREDRGRHSRPFSVDEFGRRVEIGYCCHFSRSNGTIVNDRAVPMERSQFGLPFQNGTKVTPEQTLFYPINILQNSFQWNASDPWAGKFVSQFRPFLGQKKNTSLERQVSSSFTLGRIATDVSPVPRVTSTGFFIWLTL
jgi:hypothetical protein